MPKPLKAQNGRLQVFSNTDALDSNTSFNSAKLLNGLFRNGSCQTLDNSAFTELTYSNTDIPFGSSGCFTYTSIGSNETKVADDFLLMDANSVYLIEADLKQITKVGNPLTYVGVIQYDVDGNTILPYHVIRTGDTTLAAPLSVGNTTISLTSATGWENAGSSGDRGIGFYTYKNASGQLYDRSINPYTRYVQLGMWNAGGISGNTITLAAPWAYANPDPASGGVWPAGTEVSNNKDGLSYNYILLTAVAVPTTQWTRYKAYIGGGVDLSGTDNNAKFRPGFHQAKLFMLPNYSGAAGDKIGIGNIYVGKLNGEGRFLPDSSVSTFMKTVVDDVDAATARSTLGVTTELALKLNKSDATLDAISATISGTAVAPFVYDTRNDSDGGRTMRNAGYPASFSIIATATTVTLYKNTDTTLTQIGQITGLSGVTNVFALNGWLFVGSSSGVGKYNLLNSLNLRKQYSTTSTPAVVSNSVNRITGVVLPAASIDGTTGLHTPTLYVGTMAGVSRVAEDDTVSNWTESGSVDDVYAISVIGDYVYFSTDNTTASKHVLAFPVASTLSASLYTSTTYRHISGASADSWLSTLTPIHYTATNSQVQRISSRSLATDRGLIIFQPNTTSWGSGLHATITKDFSTGWLFGDIRRAWVCEGSAGTLVGGTSPDRSYKNKPLTVNGSVVKSAVASGCDLMAYSGWSTSNYLLDALYGSDVWNNSGMYWMLWVKCTDTADIGRHLFDNSQTTGAGRCLLALNSSEQLFWYSRGNAGNTINNEVIGTLAAGVWHFVGIHTDFNTTHKAYLNGNLAIAPSVTMTTPTLSAGTLYVGVKNDLTSAGTGVAISRLRIGAGAPTAAQIKAIYESEKYNYVAGNQSLLAGTSNDCKSVAYDNFTGKHHVVTGDYYNEFKDLVRTNAIAGVWTSVSSQDDLVIKGA